MNAQDYYGTRESLQPTELAFGTLQVRDAPSFMHQEAVASFFVALREHARSRALGHVCIAPLDVVLDEPRALIVQPDVFFVSNERDGIVGSRIYGPPDLVVDEQRLEIVTFVDSAIDRRKFVAIDETIDSPCLPAFTFTLRQVLDR